MKEGTSCIHFILSVVHVETGMPPVGELFLYRNGEIPLICLTAGVVVCNLKGIVKVIGRLRVSADEIYASITQKVFPMRVDTVVFS